MSNTDDVRKMFDEKEYLFAMDLDGDITVTIESVKPGEIVGDGGKKSKKPIVSFVGAKKKLAVNRTNMKIIGSLYGYKASGWVGKQVTLYPTTTKFGNDTVECIRVRNSIPKEPQP
ncbi:MAG: hypothetical protein H0U66_04755 [Gemmatimonadaceae bacterium]|nr:hypothetical protein [Gemmatimonadaceae bacterium]